MLQFLVFGEKFELALAHIGQRDSFFVFGLSPIAHTEDVGLVQPKVCAHIVDLFQQARLVVLVDLSVRECFLKNSSE